jgi:hypothetical protein
MAALLPERRRCDGLGHAVGTLAAFSRGASTGTVGTDVVGRGFNARRMRGREGTAQASQSSMTCGALAADRWAPHVSTFQI